MQYTQFLIFEISKKCNLAEIHKGKCPCGHPDRWKTLPHDKVLSDDDIVSIAKRMYREYGFKGLIGWHYYNEPLLSWGRIQYLMLRIKAEIPESGFVLWTNGRHPPEDPNELAIFDRVFLTNYDKGDYSHIKNAVKHYKEYSWKLDGRLNYCGPHSSRPCGRMFSEFIIDYHGNVHLCCIDWTGKATPGNVITDDLGGIVTRWKRIRSHISGEAMTTQAPAACRTCTGRHAWIANLIPELHKAGQNFMQGDRNKPRRLPLLIVGVGMDPENVSRFYKVHAPIADGVEFAENYKDAGKILARFRDEYYFGLALPTFETLSGPVWEALALHPDENLLSIPRFSNAGTLEGTRAIVRLSDFMGFHGDFPAVRSRYLVHMDELRIDSLAPPKIQRLAVTFTHYRVPEKRLDEHFSWNDAIYRKFGARVVVVTDKPYPVPDYAECIVYPEEMKTFALSKTSNYGIRYCMDSGFQVVVKTDSDIVFSEEIMQKCATVEPGAVVLPLYRMALNYPERHTNFVEAPLATGTVAMHAENWRAAHYHEKCVGYGSDDGILWKEMQRQKLKISRHETLELWHIAHFPDTPQKEFDKENPRIDHWNRGTGFNPENFRHNRQLYGKTESNEQWGLQGLSDLTIVLTHYRMPEYRLRDWIRWNRDLIEEFRARVIIVSDVPRPGLPPWARVAVYPVDLDLFALTRTSNYGIRLAAQGIICKTDPDCVFSREAMEAIAAITPTDGACFRYTMALAYNGKEDATEHWESSKGTLALHFDHWDDISGYDERMRGYGIEDGIAFHAAQNIEGRNVTKSKAVLWHIAHSEMKQAHGNNRGDLWNNKTGFNPKNHKENQLVLNQMEPWKNSDWGKVFA